MLIDVGAATMSQFRGLVGLGGVHLGRGSTAGLLPHRELPLPAAHGVEDGPGGLREEATMYVEDILKVKGADVITTAPGETVGATVRLLNVRRIGAVLVRDSAGNLAGLVSERDIIRAIAVNGERALEMLVRDVMTSEVVTCRPTDTISEVMKVMTVRRFRHLPVVEGGELKGIISIGDVVKHRLEESEMETRVLRDYVIAHR